MKPSNRKLAILTPIGLAIILAVIFMAVTPQGRALAQQFLSLFFQSAPDVRPLDPTSVPGVIKPTLIIVYPPTTATLDPTTVSAVITPDRQRPGSRRSDPMAFVQTFLAARRIWLG